MALAAFNFAITAAGINTPGELVEDVWIEVRREQPGQPLTQLKADRNGSEPLGNPFLSSSGKGRLHVVNGGAFKIHAYKAGFAAELRFVPIGTMAERDFGLIFNPRGAWVDDETYETGDYVIHDGANFVSLVDDNLDNEPPSAQPADDFWQLVPAAQGPPGEGDRADIMASIPGRPRVAEIIYRIEMRFDGEFNTALSGASADVAATGTAVFGVTKNGAEFATVTFDESAVGNIALTNGGEFEAGDIVRIIAPDPRDDTLADISITLAATRGS